MKDIEKGGLKNSRNVQKLRAVKKGRHNNNTLARIEADFTLTLHKRDSQPCLCIYLTL